jgi:thiol-disulfide isomerase/thioredoxin
MQNVRRILVSVVAAVLFLSVSQTPLGNAAPDPAPTDAKVVLQDVTYDGLCKLVRDNKGKVIVLDFWGIYCVPCKKAFPHLVEMHNKFDKKKFLAISVTLDERKDPEQIAAQRKEIMKFLDKQKATLRNVWLDDPSDHWQKALDITYPFVYVFDTDNKYYKFVSDEVNPTVIENLVIELLK